MKEIDFYRTITKELGVYSVFNSIREALFYQLASLNRIPIRYEELAGLVAEDALLTQTQLDFINGSITPGDKFRHYECTEDGLKVHYFVNMSKELDGDDPIASHLQEYTPVPVNKISAISVIVLNENHARLFPRRYPKVIKHELSHASIEFVIKGNLDLEEFYFAEENSRFIEFLCDLMPYLAIPSKKENGINEYIDDSVSCFGYDAEEDKADLIKIIEDLYAESSAMADARDFGAKVNEKNHFKTLADKYVFALSHTDGKTRCDLVGITEEMYLKKELADIWYNGILDEIKSSGVEGDDVKTALNNLNHLYSNMTDE